MFTENLEQFFVGTDFGVAVVLKHGLVTIRTISAIFDSPASEISIYDRSFYDEKFYSAKDAANKPTLLCRTSDRQGIQMNDIAEVSVTEAGVVTVVPHFITFWEDDGTGTSLIHLSLDAV